MSSYDVVRLMSNYIIILCIHIDSSNELYIDIPCSITFNTLFYLKNEMYNFFLAFRVYKFSWKTFSSSAM